MRVALVILLFANVAFFAWGTWIDTPPRATPSPVAKGARPLVLASEANQKPDGAAGAAAGSAEGVTGAAAVRCVSVGPFDSQESADGAFAQLRDRGYAPRARSEEGERWDGYWVYVANLKSDLEEARVMRTLMQAALSDARIMPMSPEGRRISVGIFSERDRAERRARAIQRLGLEPQIGARKVPGTVYWMDVDQRATEPALSTEGLLPPDMPGSTLEVRACSTAG